MMVAHLASGTGLARTVTAGMVGLALLQERLIAQRQGATQDVGIAPNRLSQKPWLTPTVGAHRLERKARRLRCVLWRHRVSEQRCWKLRRRACPQPVQDRTRRPPGCNL